MFNAIRHYSFPLVLAVALHAAAAWSLYQGWNPEKELLNVIQPQTVMANLIVLEAQKPKPRVDPAAAQRARAEQEKKARDEAARKAAAEKAQREKAERDRAEREKAALDKQKADEAKKELERQKRLERLSELAASSMEDAIAQESAELASGSEEQVVQSYHAAIYDAVRRNWSRPPSARTGMSARLQVELIPTGDVVAVTIVDSSGNGAFDRSAEQAVRRVGRFEVPDENSLFEAHFRRFYILFKPEDLLR